MKGNEGFEGHSVLDLAMPMIGVISRVGIHPMYTELEGVLAGRITSIGDNLVDHLFSTIDLSHRLQGSRRVIGGVERLQHLDIEIHWLEGHQVLKMISVTILSQDEKRATPAEELGSTMIDIILLCLVLQLYFYTAVFSLTALL